jgi:hypothetical protein
MGESRGLFSFPFPQWVGQPTSHRDRDQVRNPDAANRTVKQVVEDRLRPQTHRRSNRTQNQMRIYMYMPFIVVASHTRTHTTHKTPPVATKAKQSRTSDEACSFFPGPPLSDPRRIRPVAGNINGGQVRNKGEGKSRQENPEAERGKRNQVGEKLRCSWKNPRQVTNFRSQTHGQPLPLLAAGRCGARCKTVVRRIDRCWRRRS